MRAISLPQMLALQRHAPGALTDLEKISLGLALLEDPAAGQPPSDYAKELGFLLDLLPPKTIGMVCYRTGCDFLLRWKTTIDLLKSNAVSVPWSMTFEHLNSTWSRIGRSLIQGHYPVEHFAFVADACQRQPLIDWARDLDLRLIKCVQAGREKKATLSPAQSPNFLRVWVCLMAELVLLPMPQRYDSLSVGYSSATTLFQVLFENTISEIEMELPL